MPSHAIVKSRGTSELCIRVSWEASLLLACCHFLTNTTFPYQKKPTTFDRYESHDTNFTKELRLHFSLHKPLELPAKTAILITTRSSRQPYQQPPTSHNHHKRNQKTMTEPRARPRTKGSTFSPPDLTDLLYAYGSSPRPVPSTLTTLDEILTDFIIETCHAAALSASYSRRQKIKVDDFKWVLRQDERLLGRVLEQLWRERTLREERRVMDLERMGNEGGGVDGLVGLAEAGGVAEEGRKKRRKRRRAEADGEESREAKRVAT